MALSTHCFLGPGSQYSITPLLSPHVEAGESEGTATPEDPRTDLESGVDGSRLSSLDLRCPDSVSQSLEGNRSLLLRPLPHQESEWKTLQELIATEEGPTFLFHRSSLRHPLDTLGRASFGHRLSIRGPIVSETTSCILGHTSVNCRHARVIKVGPPLLLPDTSRLSGETQT